ncbi:hypothetical protein CERZMDRAFT_97556 [Cercospora zeae-maydis SCOH1-5]|uniref:Uncharacterized protein n=1 Tax=Cercospora zeae-maydis SCOH1-5 TaxID=717836 RepID=A0A6A6FFK8_9PEZI|nr:hypothetical protein CERZMDRAFT_97556 [Cercospora zeae-maydis SCOH1-5]
MANGRDGDPESCLRNNDTYLPPTTLFTTISSNFHVSSARAVTQLPPRRLPQQTKTQIPLRSTHKHFRIFAGHPKYEQAAEECQLLEDMNHLFQAIPDDVALVQMHRAQRSSEASDWRDTRKAFVTPCQLKLRDSFIPKLDLAKQAHRTWDGANLQLSLSSRALSPSLQLTVNCY